MIDAIRPNGIALVWNPLRAKVGPFSIRLKLFFTSAYKAIQYVLGGVVQLELFAIRSVCLTHLIILKQVKLDIQQRTREELRDSLWDQKNSFMIGEEKEAGKRRQAGKECIDSFFVFFWCLFDFFLSKQNGREGEEQEEEQEREIVIVYKKQLCMHNLNRESGVRSLWIRSNQHNGWPY